MIWKIALFTTANGLRYAGLSSGSYSKFKLIRLSALWRKFYLFFDVVIVLDIKQVFSVYHPSSPSSHGGRGRRWRQSGSAPPAPIDITAWIVSATGVVTATNCFNCSSSPSRQYYSGKSPVSSGPMRWSLMNRRWEQSLWLLHTLYYTGGFRSLIRKNKIT